MHPEILREIGDRLTQVVIAWPMLVTDSVEERLDPLYFRLRRGDPLDELWRVWQANNLDEESQLGRVDALVMKRSYLAVGTNEKDADTPLVTVESPLEVFADIDPRDRSVRAAIRHYDEPATDARQREEFATVYLPNMTVHYDLTSKGWNETGRDEHKLGKPPILPLVNRARLSDRYGRSELSPILPLAHAANKLATDMMVGAEFLALPLRGIFGIGPNDLEDEAGNKMSALQAILGRLLTLQDESGNAKMFEFTSADLGNFHNSINQLARLAASISGLPPDYFGLATENPPSAESRKAGEVRLIKRAERKQTAFGGTYEELGRFIDRFQTGEWNPELRRLEMVWRDAATPTRAQTADAVVKLLSTPKPVLSLRQAREDLGYTDAAIARMEDDDTREAANDPLTAMVRQGGQQQSPAVEE
jgi:hypothetical protein